MLEAGTAPLEAPRRLRGSVVMVLGDLNGGGLQLSTLRVARGLADRGAKVTLAVMQRGGRLEACVPEGVEVVSIQGGGEVNRWRALMIDPALSRVALRPLLASSWRSPTTPWVPGLARFLAERRPDAVLSSGHFMNVESYLAVRAAGVPTRLVVAVRSFISEGKPRNVWRAKHMGKAMRRAYAAAERVLVISRGLADDVAGTIGVPRGKISVIHNPTLTPDFAERAAGPCDHPWLQGPKDARPPVVIGVGRPTVQKDFPTLLRAFASVRRGRPARLVIVGELANRKMPEALQTLARELGVAEHVDFAGFRENPLPLMREADVFALSSRYEGFGNVLLEALALGTPVVSTDCPAGPSEILDGGRYGRLVPVGDAQAMAEAISATLDSPPAPAFLRGRADDYSYGKSIDGYADLLLPPAP